MEMLFFQSPWFRLKKDFEKDFRFPENLFQIKVLKTFETFTDCHLKTYRSLKLRAILKIPITVF